MKAVIFDMDGVLIDSEGIYLEQLFKFAKDKNHNLKIEDLHPMIGNSREDAWRVMEKAVHNGQSWEALRDDYHQIRVNQEIDYRLIYRQEATELLQELTKKGYLLALASSTELVVIEKVLQENNINRYFGVVVSGEQFTRSKPDPEIYHYTAKKLSVKESECFVIEDSTVGITAAKAAGMKVAALTDTRYHFDQSKADYMVENLKDILNILNENR